MSKGKKKQSGGRSRRQKDKQHLKDIEDRMVQKGARAAVNALGVIPCYALRTEFGFGAARLERFSERFKYIFDMVCDKKVSLETLAGELEHDCGFCFELDEDKEGQ